MAGFTGKPVTKKDVIGSKKSDSAAADTHNVKAKIAATGSDADKERELPKK